jgi:thiol:disulfide interchange protein DsbD
MLAIAIALVLSRAQAGPVDAQLVASVSAVKAGEPFLAAVVFHCDPDWHLFWQNPGDVGKPPTIVWKLPSGWTAGEIQWPTPERFVNKQQVSYGYSGGTILLVTITPSADAKAGPATIAATAAWTAMKTELVSGSQNLHLGLTVMPVKSGPHRIWGDRLAAAQAAMPQAIEGWKLEASAIKDGYLLKVTPPEKQNFDQGLPRVYGSDPGVLDAAYPIAMMVRDDGSFWLAIKQATPVKPTDRLRGLLVAPPGTKWKDQIDAILLDVPITPAKG